MNKIAIIILFAVALNSCYDEKMEWGRDPSYGDVTVAELPLPLKEAISRYDALKTYTDFKLGVGIGFDLYMSSEAYRNTVNENFDDVTAGYEMKHAAMVNGQGELNFTNVDNTIAALKQNGLTVYGHTLVWHQNQNASYLNSLIAPEVIPSAGESQLDVTNLLNGSFTGWNRNNASGITIVEGAGLNNGPAIRFSTTTAGNEWDTQLTSPEIPAIVGHAYEFSFWIKSDDAGQGRLSFAGMANNYPWIGGGAYFNSTGSWTQVVYNEIWDNDASANVPFTAVANVIKLAFDMGKFPGVYYVDINSLSVIDKDAEPAEQNLVTNGDFESGDLTGWTALNPGAGIEVTDAEKFAGSYSLKATSGSSAANAWDLQFECAELALDASKSYTFSFMIKSNIAGKGRISFPGGMNGNQYPWMDWMGTGSYSEAFTTSASWSQIAVTMTNTSNVKLSFDMGYLPDVTYYIDDVKVVEQVATESAPSLQGVSPSLRGISPSLRGTKQSLAPSSQSALRAGPTIIDKTDAEKAAIIGEALEAWISRMVGHYKSQVSAWDVVNEPMDDGKPSDLKTGKNQTDLASDAFYWQDYLGKDYAVTAFKLARQYGNADDVLFINDYNLEQNLAKCDGLIAYVQYIESKGAKVDGIGTQMHISLNTNRDNIVSMFQKLAATGKKIKISEMDVTLETASPTAEQLEQQADMYRFVVESYIKYIPAAQRYGITVWGVSDNPDEHENWLPDASPNLWDADYARKHAYKGFADGLAGKDISADFSGELVY